MKYFRALAQQNPDAYLPNVAETLMNLGNHERTQNQIEAARQHYEQSSRIYRQLRSKIPINIYRGLRGRCTTWGD